MDNASEGYRHLDTAATEIIQEKLGSTARRSNPHAVYWHDELAEHTVTYATHDNTERPTDDNRLQAEIGLDINADLNRLAGIVEIGRDCRDKLVAMKMQITREGTIEGHDGYYFICGEKSVNLDELPSALDNLNSILQELQARVAQLKATKDSAA